jgi:hypothetical protein
VRIKIRKTFFDLEDGLSEKERSIEIYTRRGP